MKQDKQRSIHQVLKVSEAACSRTTYFDCKKQTRQRIAYQIQSDATVAMLACLTTGSVGASLFSSAIQCIALAIARHRSTVHGEAACMALE